MPASGGSRPSKTKVFISYSRKDMAFADRLVTALEARELDVSIDRRDLPLLEEWQRELIGSIRAADAVVFLVSPSSIMSKWCEWEVAQVTSLNKRLAPVVVQPVTEDIPEAIRKINFLYFTPPNEFEDQADKLAAALNTDIGWVKEHTRLGERARRWEEGRRASALLLRGSELSDAEAWAQRRPQTAPVPTTLHLAYLSESRRAEGRRRNVLTASLASGLAVALGLAGLAYWQRTIAVRNEETAREQARIASVNEAQSMAALSKVATNQGFYSESITLGLAALPRSKADRRPFVSAPLESISFALSSQPPILSEFRHAAVVKGAIWYKNETRVASWSHDRTLRIWNVSSSRQVGQPMEHPASVEGARLTGDEQQILTWCADGSLRIWSAGTSQQIAQLQPPESASRVNGALFIDNDRRVVAWHDDGLIRVWDIASGKQDGVSMRHEGPVIGVLISKDEKRLISWSSDATLRTWNTASGQAIGPIMKHDNSVLGAVLTDDETRLVSWSGDGTVRIWQTGSGSQFGPSMQHTNSVLGALLVKNQTMIVSWSLDGTIRLWNATTGRPQGPEMKHDGVVLGVTPTKRSDELLSWSDDGSVRFWNTTTGKQAGPSLKHDSSVVGATLSADENRVLTWSADSSIRIWDRNDRHQIGLPMVNDGPVYSALLSSDNARVMSWSDAGKRLRVWDIAVGRQAGPALKHDDHVEGAIVTSQEARVLTWSRDNTARLWDLTSRRQIGPAMPHDNWVVGAHILSKGRRVLTWGYDIRLWDLASGKALATMKHGGLSDPRIGNLKLFNGVAVDEAEARITSYTHELQVWDAETGGRINLGRQCKTGTRMTYAVRGESPLLCWDDQARVQLLDVVSGRPMGSPIQLLEADGTIFRRPLNGYRLTRDRTRMLAWLPDDTLLQWELATGRQIARPMLHAGTIREPDDGMNPQGVLAAAYSNDETRILSWGANGTVKIWNAVSSEQIGATMTHEDYINGAVFSANENRVLSWSSDRTVRLWDATSGQQLGASMKHEGAASGAVFSKDQTRIISWSADSTVRLWDAATGYQIGPPMSHGGPVNGALLIKNDTRVLSWSVDGTIREWDISWRGRSLAEIACAYSPADHDVEVIAQKFGVSINDPICQEQK